MLLRGSRSEGLRIEREENQRQDQKGFFFGRRFGFVRFINVFNEEGLVNNICTVWIDHFKLHANIARFHRIPLNETPKKAGGVKKDTGVNEVGNSYMHVVKGQMQPGNKESEANPALVLSDECLLSKDLSKSLFGRVKQFASLAKIRKAVSNEGFTDIKIQYMGELWVLMEFVLEDSMKLFQDNVSIGSWFSQLKQASMKLNIKGRIAWVEVEGIPFKLWSDNTFKRIATKAFWICAKEAPGWVPDFMEENDNEEQNDGGGFNVHESGSYGGNSDVKGVLKTIFKESGQKENNLDEEHTNKQENHSRDPFSIYKLLKKKKDNVEKENNSKHSMKYPLGFTPKEGTDVVGMHTEESRSDSIVNLIDHNTEEVKNTFSGNCPKKNSKEDVLNLVCSGYFKTSMVPRTGGSILSLMDELVKVGQAIGYKMDGYMSCMTEIIESQGVKEVIQEGVWRQNDNDLLIIAVYAPHDLKDKQMLWDYLTYEIGANVFNSFITNAGLKEVPLGGSSFTWCRKSATKMSKLDRFLISKNLLNTRPSITAITLERYLFNHRPILLRESHFDYGPTPFRFFHHWIEMEGFSKVVEDTWREGPYELEALEEIFDKGDGNVKGFAAVLAVLKPERLKADIARMCEEASKVESCPSEIILDDLLALDSIVRFDFE
nr:nucleotide-binding alpha-beta plait domain-containing protein [Tanacetum cinerariifolium]